MNLGLSSETKARAVGVEDNILALQEDITKDREAQTRVALDTTEALGGALRDGGVVDQITRNDSIIAGDGNREVRQGSRAIEGVATSRGVRSSTADLLVVGGDDLIIEQQEGGTGVSNTLDGAAGLGADLVAVSGEAPEALRAVDISVGQGSGVLGLVSEAEVVGAGGVVLQGDGEERRSESRLHGVEEGGLRLGLDSVDRAESETEQAVVVLVLGELLADLGGSLDSLTGGLDSADGDGILVDITAGGAAVSVGDGPGVARQLGAVVRLVEAVTLLLRSGKLRGENPAEITISFDILCMYN